MSNFIDQEDLGPDAADAELERLLGEAYNVPPVPRSLLKRLDRSLGEQWGVSSELSGRASPVLVRVALRGARVLRSWPIAASLVLALIAAVTLQNKARAYGWAQMLDALGRAPLVQLAAPDGTTRWLSLTSGFVSVSSPEALQVFDFTRGVALRRQPGDSQITRRVFRSASSTPPRDAMAIAFFLENISEDGDLVSQSNLRVIDESWSAAGNKNGFLCVKLGSPSETVELRIAVDRVTRLPQAFDVQGQRFTASTLTLSYPDLTAPALLARDTTSGGSLADAVAAHQPAATGDDLSPLEVKAESAAGQALTQLDPAAIAALEPEARLPWKPVPEKVLSLDEAVERIDSTLAALWEENQISPAGPAGDEELLRRVYLDLTGRIPTVSEVRDYLADDAPDRYARLVDRLLASRDHATHLATVWRTYLIPEGIDLSRFGGTESFEAWLGEQIFEQVPYDELVRRLLLAEGRLTESGPLLFYAAVKLDPDQLAARTARVFLGLRLDCAQCHDDPFEPWRQEDFWGFAAFFARISRPQAPLESVSTVMRVRDIDRGEVKLPESETVVLPQFLNGRAVADDSEAVARRSQLARWMTAEKNPFFARAAANRVWGLLFGKGIVNPVDGFGEQHEAVSQELLDQLASHLISSDFDLRLLFRSIALSRAYRLSSGDEEHNPRQRELFAQMNVKLLTAEQMYDCITVASMLDSREGASGFSLNRVGNSRRAEFLQQFRAPPGRPTEYQSGIPQALTLMNGELIGDATGLGSSGLLKSLEAPFFTNSQRVETLYLATLSRRPTPAEWELLSGYMGEDAAGREVLADILWALLNSAEFTMNH